MYAGGMSYLSSGSFGFGCEACLCAETLAAQTSKTRVITDTAQPIADNCLFMTDNSHKVEALTRRTVEAMHKCPIPNDLPEPLS